MNCERKIHKLDIIKTMSFSLKNILKLKSMKNIYRTYLIKVLGAPHFSEGRSPKPCVGSFILKKDLFPRVF